MKHTRQHHQPYPCSGTHLLESDGIVWLLFPVMLRDSTLKLLIWPLCFSDNNDDNGNRTQQRETNGGAEETTTYQYDVLDRLEQVTYPDTQVTYTYDNNYNRTGEQTMDIASSALTSDKVFTYNNRNQLTTITDNLDAAQNVVYQYDANGNQIIKTKAGATTTFIYDVRDKLTSVRQDATTLGTYLYDYQGMRVAKTTSEGIVNYTYDQDALLLQHDQAGTTIAKYEYGPDRLLMLNHATEGRQFYLFDALGSIANLIRPDTTISARYQYDAWGNFRKQSGSSANKFGFTGQERDDETGLYYFKARFYDPDTARFLTQDSFLGEAGTPPSLHRYLYAYSNPTVYIDPTGNAAVFNFTDQQITDIQQRAANGQGLQLFGPISSLVLRLGLSEHASGINLPFISTPELSPEGTRLLSEKLTNALNSPANRFGIRTLVLREASESPEEAVEGVLSRLKSNPEGFRESLRKQFESNSPRDFVDISDAAASVIDAADQRHRQEEIVRIKKRLETLRNNLNNRPGSTSVLKTAINRSEEDLRVLQAGEFTDNLLQRFFDDDNVPSFLQRKLLLNTEALVLGAVSPGAFAGKIKIRSNGGSGGQRKLFSNINSSENMVAQIGEFSCGSACAEQLLKDFDIKVSQEDLIRLTNTTDSPFSRGVTADKIAEALNKVQNKFEFQGGVVGAENFGILAKRTPFIANINPGGGGHFVIVDKVERGFVRIRDPDPSGLNVNQEFGIEATIKLDDFLRMFERTDGSAVFINRSLP